MPNFLQTLEWLQFWKKASNQLQTGHSYFIVRATVNNKSDNKKLANTKPEKNDTLENIVKINIIEAKD